MPQRARPGRGRSPFSPSHHLLAARAESFSAQVLGQHAFARDGKHVVEAVKGLLGHRVGALRLHPLRAAPLDAVARRKTAQPAARRPEVPRNASLFRDVQGLVDDENLGHLDAQLPVVADPLDHVGLEHAKRGGGAERGLARVLGVPAVVVLFDTAGSMLATRVISPYSGFFPSGLSLTAANLASHCSVVRSLASLVPSSSPTATSREAAAAAAIL